MGCCLSPCVYPIPGRDKGAEGRLLAHPGLVWLTTSKGARIPALYLQQHTPDDEDRFTVLCTHGNSETVDISLGFFLRLQMYTKANVFAVEYEGYGLSEGNGPSESKTYEDAELAYQYLVNEAGVDPKKIVFFGRSLGSGPATEMAHRHSDSAGLILISPLASIFRTQGAGCCLASVLPCIDLYRNAAKIGSIQCPVFIIHGTDDRVVPCENGRFLHDRCQRPFPPVWVEGAGHNDVERVYGGQRYFGSLKKFLESLKAGREPPTEGAEKMLPSKGDRSPYGVN
eukprot:Hpha_TRINITY_DN31306_c0_g1::TRINITY_DN31306_c0_g1_i1::g.194581::m.194581